MTVEGNGQERVLDIVRLGAQGDGVALTPEGAVFVPYTLPGERVRAKVCGDRGELLEVLVAAGDRIVPVCRHFTRCGGCVLQHAADPAYAAWKQTLVADAFRQRGLEPDIQGLIRMPLGARRRAVFTARRTRKTVVVGYHDARDPRSFALEECPVLEPSIVASMSTLRAIAGPLLSRNGEIRLGVTVTATGLDVAIEGAGGKRDAATRSALARLAAEAGLARLSIDGDVIATLAEPAVQCGPVRVAIPPGGFLQAVKDAEHVIARLVVQGLGGARHVADLFAGVGALTFPIAKAARVLAVDGDTAAIAALRHAARNAAGLKPIEGKVRDLFREPLSAKELEPFDGVVFDPPRAGADAQARALAGSGAARVVAVSCNPATLARDVRTLVDGGYRLGRVTPIDQFVYSAHVEAVAVLER